MTDKEAIKEKRYKPIKNKIKCELYNDSMQGWKCYPIQKAQLIIADVPYNVGKKLLRLKSYVVCRWR